MTFVYLGLYIALLLGIWGFYAVARMHTMKFKNFSTHIAPVTNILMVFLIILSIIWFILVLNLNWDDSTYELQITENTNNSESSSEWQKNNSEWREKNYEQEIIWDDYY